jgi:hypothetical protein
MRFFHVTASDGVSLGSLRMRRVCQPSDPVIADRDCSRNCREACNSPEEDCKLHDRLVATRSLQAERTQRTVSHATGWCVHVEWNESCSTLNDARRAAEQELHQAPGFLKSPSRTSLRRLRVAANTALSDIGEMLGCVGSTRAGVRCEEAVTMAVLACARLAWRVDGIMQLHCAAWSCACFPSRHD